MLFSANTTCLVYWQIGCIHDRPAIAEASGSDEGGCFGHTYVSLKKTHDVTVVFGFGVDE
eukprot:scaffold38696_cov80-Attheya_sp.AAC.3